MAFDQMSPLGDLSVRWTGGDDPESVAELRIDEFEGVPDPPPEPTDLTDPTTPDPEESA